MMSLHRDGLWPEVLVIDFAVAGPEDGTQNMVESTKQEHGEFEATILAMDATGATRNFYKGVIA